MLRSITCFKSKSIEWTGMLNCCAKPFVVLYDKDLTCRLAVSIALTNNYNHNMTNSTLYLLNGTINICISSVPQSQIPLTCPGSGVDRHGNTSTSTNWGWTLANNILISFKNWFAGVCQSLLNMITCSCKQSEIIWLSCKIFLTADTGIASSNPSRTN